MSWSSICALAAAACSAALVAGPVSAWARRYVRRSPGDEVGPAGPEGADASLGAGAAEAVEEALAEVRGSFAEGAAGPAAGAASTSAGPAVPAETSSPAPAPAAGSAGPVPPEQHLRRLGLLAPVPQGVLALVACGLCAWWGVRLGAVGATLVAVPVYALLTVAGSVDVVAHLLPNRLLGSAAVWLAACGLVALAVHPASAGAALRAVLCALGAGGGSLVFAFIGSGLGLGDVKLCAVIGLWLGWYSGVVLLVALCAGVFLGGLTALALLAARRVGRKDPMAYGPYLVAGALIAWPLAVV